MFCSYHSNASYNSSIGIYGVVLSMNYWLKKSINISQLMLIDTYKDRLEYLCIIQRFFIKMYFRSLTKRWKND